MSQPFESLPQAIKIAPYKATKINKDPALVEELRVQWKQMWSERFNDKVKAEGVSVADYTAIHVERGTVIHATKDFKALNFKDILEERLIENPDRYVSPSPSVGGWSKFIKTKVTSGKTVKEKCVNAFVPAKPVGGQPKKGGRGWLHTV